MRAAAVPVLLAALVASVALVAAAGRPAVGIAAAALCCACCAALLSMGRRADRTLAAERAARRAESLRFNTAIDHMSQGLCFFDGAARLIVCNQRYATIYKLRPEDVVPGTTLQQIVDRRYAAGTTPAMTRAEYLAWRSGIAQRHDPSDTVAELRDGRMIAIHHQPMPDGGWVATHEDVTERRRALAQIERLAHHDPLTGLANRFAFRSRFEAALDGSGAAAAEAPVAVLCLDLDRFKAVNDTLGHPAGDELLRAVAARLLACVRTGDVVARLGGDEFAIVQRGGRQPASALALGERIVHALDQPFALGGPTATVGVSVGIALAPLHGSDPDMLLRKADIALYSIKAGGRGGCALFDPAIDAELHDRRRFEADLAQAAARGELELHYQPIVALAPAPDGGSVVAREALLRWRHPQRGLVMPDAFIPLAEATGSIEALGRWVLDTAFAAAAGWPRPIAVAVNLSPLQIAGGRIVADVAAALRSSGLDPSRVELEITESVPLAENEANLATLHALRALGVRICVDDFGVGYSSLGYLRAFAFDRLKIDRSFVRDIGHDAEAAAIVGSIVALAHRLGMRVTGEGVENAAQRALLDGMGCDEAQGWLFGRPQPLPAAAPRPRPTFEGIATQSG